MLVRDVAGLMKLLVQQSIHQAMLMRLKSIKSNETEEQSQSNMSVRDNYGSVVRLKSIKSNNLSMM